MKFFAIICIISSDKVLLCVFFYVVCNLKRWFNKHLKAFLPFWQDGFAAEMRKKNQKNKNAFPFKLDQQNGNEIDFGETNEILEK